MSAHMKHLLGTGGTLNTPIAVFIDSTDDELVIYDASDPLSFGTEINVSDVNFGDFPSFSQRPPIPAGAIHRDSRTLYLPCENPANADGFAIVDLSDLTSIPAPSFQADSQSGNKYCCLVTGDTLVFVTSTDTGTYDLSSDPLSPSYLDSVSVSDFIPVPHFGRDRLWFVSATGDIRGVNLTDPSAISSITASTVALDAGFEIVAAHMIGDTDNMIIYALNYTTRDCQVMVYDRSGDTLPGTKLSDVVDTGMPVGSGSESDLMGAWSGPDADWSFFAFVNGSGGVEVSACDVSNPSSIITDAHNSGQIIGYLQSYVTLLPTADGAVAYGTNGSSDDIGAVDVSDETNITYSAIKVRSGGSLYALAYVGE